MQSKEIPSGLRAAKTVARDYGVTPITIWRWVQRGWLSAVNVAGRPYITSESRARFDERAAKGEFAKPPSGAARIQSEKRKAQKESATAA